MAHSFLMESTQRNGKSQESKKRKNLNLKNLKRLIMFCIIFLKRWIVWWWGC